jgi:hypothetical protein
MTIRRASLAVLAALAVAALPAATASATGPVLNEDLAAALARAEAKRLQNGADAGRVAVAADIAHPADVMGRTETVRLTLSRGGTTLGTGLSRMRLPRRRGLTVTHRVVLSAAESRRARAAARHGRLRVTASIRSDVRGASSATATVALGSSSLPPIGACYTDDPARRTAATTVWVQQVATGYAVVEVETFPNPAGASWSPTGGFAPIAATPDAGLLYAAQWNAPGTWVIAGTNADGTAITATTRVSGAFSGDGQTASVSWNSVPFVPNANVLLQPC